MGARDSHNYLRMEAQCAHLGLLPIRDQAGRRRWEATCGRCGLKADYFRADLHTGAEQIVNHFAKTGWVLSRNASPFCSTQCSKAARQIAMEKKMPSIKAPPPVAIGPNPLIMRRVITLLNDCFDMERRLYREGWSDERVAREAETSPDFVVTFRRSAYGELAEDPMISKLRGDVAALKELFEQEVAKLRAQFEPQFKEIDYKLARLIGQRHKAAG